MYSIAHFLYTTLSHLPSVHVFYGLTSDTLDSIASGSHVLRQRLSWTHSGDDIVLQLVESSIRSIPIQVQQRVDYNIAFASKLFRKLICTCSWLKIHRFVFLDFMFLCDRWGLHCTHAGWVIDGGLGACGAEDLATFGRTK